MNTEAQFSRAFTAGAAITKYARVTITAGVLQVAGLTDEGIGHAAEPAFAAGEVITVYLDGPVRTGIAIEAFSAGARLYTEASGKIQDTAAATGFPLGIALEDASGDGHEVQYMLKPGAEANP